MATTAVFPDRTLKTVTYPVKVHILQTLNIDGMGGATETKMAKEPKVMLGQNPVLGRYQELSASRVHLAMGCEDRILKFHLNGNQLTLVPEKGEAEVYVRQN